MREQAIDEDPHGRVELDACQVGVHPLHSIDLGIEPAAHLEHPGLQCIRVEIGFNGVGDDDLPRFQGCLTEVDPGAGRRLPPGFLGELAGCGLEVALIGLDYALYDRPPPIVPSGEIGATGMGYEQLQTRRLAEWEKTRGSH